MILKRLAIRSVAWASLGNVLSQVIRMVTLVSMARLLAPEDFGVFAILQIFVGFFQIFTNMGVGQVVIFLADPQPRVLSAVFMLNLTVSFLFYCILFISSWPIALFFDNSNLRSLLQCIGILFVINSITAVHRALLEKRLEFKTIFIVDVTSQFVGAILGIIAACLGFGAWSLIAIVLSTAAVKSVSLWSTSVWTPGFEFSLQHLKDVWKYCFQITGFSLVNYFARSADNFLIGKYLGNVSLGAYSLAYALMLYPITNVSGVISRVLFPALASLKSDDVRFRSAYLAAIRVIALLTFPLMAGLFVTADLFVQVFLGDSWEPVGMLLKVLAPVGLMQSIVTTVGQIYMSKGTTGLMLKVGSANSLVTVLFFALGLPFGVTGVAAAYATANAIMLYPNLWFAWSQIDLGVLQGMKIVFPSLIAALGMALIVFLVDHNGVADNAAPIVRLGIMVSSGACCYVSILAVLDRYVCDSVYLSMVRTMVSKTVFQ